MTLIVTVAGWMLTGALLACCVRARRRGVLVARACHELRGPLFALRLGLEGLGGEPVRRAALELEVERAARALDDLAAARTGSAAESRTELVDVAALVRAYADTWRTLASGFGARLSVAPPRMLLPPDDRRTARPATERHPRAPTAAGSPRRAAPVGSADAVAVAERPRRARTADAGEAVAVAERPRTADSDEAVVVAERPCTADSGEAVAVAEHPRRASAAGSADAAVALVRADPLRIAQACANLVGNAAEHGGGVVRVRVCVVGDVVRIEVADDGPGLPASLAAFVAEARGRRGRRGHGLAIAAAIAEHHGGRLFTAPAATGTRMMLELPAAMSGAVVA